MNLVAGVDLRLGDEVAVHFHAVRRLEVDDPPSVVAILELGVLARHRGMVEDDVVSLSAADGEIRLQIKNAGDAHVDVMDLELFHFGKAIIPRGYASACRRRMMNNV